MGLEALFGFFESGEGGLAGDGGEAIEKVLECFSAFEVVEESLQGHTGTAEDGGSAEDVRVSDDDVHSGIVARRKSRVLVGVICSALRDWRIALFAGKDGAGSPIFCWWRLGLTQEAAEKD
jgi:hypothetical protein